MKSGEEFFEELKEFKPLIYCRGEKVDDFLRPPVLKPVKGVV